ncbi:hypothetical protein FQA39_LY13345 [Lamprigera yunnana]|nr:hypothetical protein FQA39_LY13345 [Lamprigera yunnana]
MEDAENESYVPQINIELEGLPQNVLIDTGQCEGKTDIPVISAVAIQGITGRICKIKKQALINLQIVEYYHPLKFLIAPNISVQCILETDIYFGRKNLFGKVRRPPREKSQVNKPSNKYRSQTLQTDINQFEQSIVDNDPSRNYQCDFCPTESSGNSQNEYLEYLKKHSRLVMETEVMLEAERIDVDPSKI